MTDRIMEAVVISPSDRAILTIAAQREWQSFHRLANLLDRDCNSQFRGRLTLMVDRGFLEHRAGQYRLTTVGKDVIACPVDA